jgi:oxygen-independent coproporphyrinogen-3 oxidase
VSRTALLDRGPLDSCSSLYVHVPYCSDRCTYCAFATVADRPEDHPRLVEGLLAELGRAPPLAPLSSIYLGGGTPGILAPELIRELLDAVRAGHTLTPDAELTLEVNPTNVDRSRLVAWSEAGVTRLSIGVQTFRDDVLAGFGRHHTGQQARHALELLASHWPGTWSADLLVGWESQDQADLQNDLALLLQAEPPHVSVYGLTIEEGTPLSKRHENGFNVTVDDEQKASLDSTWSETLGAEGYERYEVSNFALPGHRSRHNQVYWRNDDCLGIGPGASSSIGPFRWSNIRATDHWVQTALEGKTTRAHTERLAPEEKLLECLGSGLRTLDGLDTDDLDRRFSRAWRTRLQACMDMLTASGHLQQHDSRLRIPAQSLVRADAVAVALARALGQPGSSIS